MRIHELFAYLRVRDAARAIGHHLEDVSPEEMQRRYTRMMQGTRAAPR